MQRPPAMLLALLLAGPAAACSAPPVGGESGPCPVPEPCPRVVSSRPQLLRVPPSRAPLAVRAPRVEGFVATDLPLAEVQSRVRQSGRPALLFFCTRTCGYCDRMDRETLSRPEVGARLASGFVAVRYDADAPQGRTLSQRFRLPGYPTAVVVDADGTEVGRIVGFRTAVDLLAELARYP